MKKITFILIASLFFSCEKKETQDASTEETMSVDSTNETEVLSPDNQLTSQFSAEFQGYDSMYENAVFDDLNLDNVEDIKLEEVSNLESPINTLKNDNDLCSNSSHLKIKDLNSNTSYQLYQVSKLDEASLAALGFSGSINNRESLIVKDYVRTKNIVCNGKSMKVGIGLRCFIHITSRNYRGGANLATLAAEVQLQQQNAEYKILSLGFSIDGEEFRNIKSTGTYDVNSFVEVEKTFDKVVGYLNSNNEMDIDPVYLP